jgi:hypothetical protein
VPEMWLPPCVGISSSESDTPPPETVFSLGAMN